MERSHSAVIVVEYLLVGAAVHRLVAIWLREELARPLRMWAQSKRGRMAYLSTCPLCLSVWASAICLALWQSSAVGRFVVGILSLSELAIWIDALLSRASTQPMPPDTPGGPLVTPHRPLTLPADH